MILALPKAQREGGPHDKPVLVVLAGPNGAGKTTFFDTYLRDSGIHFVNADLIAKRLRRPASEQLAYEAARRADVERRKWLAKGESFCMETVFSDPAGDKLGFLRDAQAAGYAVSLVFVGLASPMLAIARVMQRVEDGGHDVPDTKIRARFVRSLRNLRRALGFVDYAYLFDNSSAVHPYRMVATYKAGRVVRRARMRPSWAENMPGLA